MIFFHLCIFCINIDSFEGLELFVVVCFIRRKQLMQTRIQAVHFFYTHHSYLLIPGCYLDSV